MRRTTKVNVQNGATKLTIAISLDAASLTKEEMANAMRQVALKVIRSLPEVRYLGLDELDVVRAR